VLAVALHGNPLTLPVSENEPISTDPHATLAWSGSLTPSLKTDLSWRSIFRHGGQEPVQMFFEGHGVVIAQPFKDPAPIEGRLRPLKRLKAMLTR